MREQALIHKAVIKSNYAAVNSLLHSAIVIRELLAETIEITGNATDKTVREFAKRNLESFLPDSVVN